MPGLFSPNYKSDGSNKIGFMESRPDIKKGATNLYLNRTVPQPIQWMEGYMELNHAEWL